jgi:hypothetical protein
MNQPTTASRNQLRSIARRRMTELGLRPDLTPAMLADTAAFAEVPTDPEPSGRYRATERDDATPAAPLGARRIRTDRVQR